MHNNEKFDRLGLVGKLVVDFSSMDELRKMKWKFGIDIAVDFLKMIAGDSPYVQQIRRTAQQCNLERVVAFQCLVNGEEKLLFKLSGGDTLAFCQHMGIQALPEKTAPMVLPYVSEVNEQYGVVLYERKS